MAFNFQNPMRQIYFHTIGCQEATIKSYKAAQVHNTIRTKTKSTFMFTSISKSQPQTLTSPSLLYWIKKAANSDWVSKWKYTKINGTTNTIPEQQSKAKLLYTVTVIQAA